MTLTQIQAELHRFLTTPQAAAGRLEGLVAGPGGEALERRLGLYAHSVRWRTAQRLASHYGRVAAVLGRAVFDAVAGEHLACRTGDDTAFARLVRALPEFLEREGARWGRPDLGALARVERARNRLAQRRGAAALDGEALRRADPRALAGMRLRFGPLAAVASAYDLDELWGALDAGTRAPAPRPRRVTYVVWQRDGQVWHRAAGVREARALRRARAGATLARVCAVFSGCADPAAAAHDALSGWLEDGLVVGLDADVDAEAARAPQPSRLVSPVRMA